MSGAGHDIWDNADDFRFAYKSLTGNGSIVVKVESLVNTNAWAKAGVMIRQSLDADSKFAYMIVSYSSGVSFGWRQLAAGTCGSATQAGIAAPQWVKLTRTGDVFTAQYSADGKTWLDIKNADGTVATTTVAMTGPVYIGLCVTSHNAAATTVAVMSGAATTGNVTGSWQVAAIGDDPQTANSPADSVRDRAGQRRQDRHGDQSDGGDVGRVDPVEDPAEQLHRRESEQGQEAVHRRRRPGQPDQGRRRQALPRRHRLRPPGPGAVVQVRSEPDRAVAQERLSASVRSIAMNARGLRPS